MNILGLSLFLLNLRSDNKTLEYNPSYILFKFKSHGKTEINGKYDVQKIKVPSK